MRRREGARLPNLELALSYFLSALFLFSAARVPPVKQAAVQILIARACEDPALLAASRRQIQGPGFPAIGFVARFPGCCAAVHLLARCWVDASAAKRSGSRQLDWLHAKGGTESGAEEPKDERVNGRLDEDAIGCNERREKRTDKSSRWGRGGSSQANIEVKRRGQDLGSRRKSREASGNEDGDRFANGDAKQRGWGRWRQEDIMQERALGFYLTALPALDPELHTVGIYLCWCCGVNALILHNVCVSSYCSTCDYAHGYGYRSTTNICVCVPVYLSLAPLPLLNSNSTRYDLRSHRPMLL